MKIVDVATKRVYRFNCPNCGSRLGGRSRGTYDVGGGIRRFFLPDCIEENYIWWAGFSKKKIF